MPNYFIVCDANGQQIGVYFPKAGVVKLAIMSTTNADGWCQEAVLAGSSACTKAGQQAQAA